MSVIFARWTYVKLNLNYVKEKYTYERLKYNQI